MTTIAPPAQQPNRILGYLKRYRREYLGGLVLLLVAGAAQQLAPFVLRFAIDDLDEGTRFRALLGFGGLILGLAVVEGALRYYSRRMVSGSARYIEYHLRGDLASHLLRLDQRFYGGARTGDLMARCTNDLQWVRDFLGPIVVDISRTLIMLVIGFGFLLAIDVKLGLIAMVYLPMVGVLVAYSERVVERRYQAVQEQIGHLTNRAQENISGIRAIKAHAQEEAEIATFYAENQEMRRRALRLAMWTSLLFPFMILATGAATALVLWFGGRDVVEGRITLGQFVQFNTILALLAVQLSGVGWLINGWQQGLVSLRRINGVLNTEPEIRDPEQPVRPLALRGEIRFEGVTAAYEGEPVLRDIDLHVPAGAMLAVAGETGSGKSTLVNLLTRLQDPVAGRITIDGIDIRDLELAHLREVVAVVPQESFLFSDSLRDNVSFGRPNPPDAAIAAVVEASQLVNDLQQLTGGLDTVIGERGVTLSGGQKQRAAIARALLKESPVLVMDDALSHVDTHTEEEILRRLKDFTRDRTTIIIAHRTSTLRDADWIAVFDEGRLVEQGSHEELLDHKGPYARIYREQLLTELRARDVDADLIEGDPEGGAQ